MGVKVAKPGLDREIARVAEEQRGAVSHQQLIQLGLTRRAISARVRAGRLHRRHRGVYTVGHRVLTVAGKRQAALLAHGAGAVLSHATAADLWGLRPTSSPTVDVLVITRGGRARQAGIRLHRTLFLPDPERTTEDGLAVTSWPRTVLDMAASRRDVEDIRVMLDRAVHLRLFDSRALQAVLGPIPRGRAARGSRRCSSAIPLPT